MDLINKWRAANPPEANGTTNGTANGTANGIAASAEAPLIEEISAAVPAAPAAAPASAAAEDASPADSRDQGDDVAPAAAAAAAAAVKGKGEVTKRKGLGMAPGELRWQQQIAPVYLACLNSKALLVAFCTLILHADSTAHTNAANCWVIKHAPWHLGAASSEAPLQHSTYMEGIS
jgi:hypothetical protein